MPDWAIVLLAAFGGGLAGAVLQPLTTYAMDRRRLSHPIRQQRAQRLRHIP